MKFSDVQEGSIKKVMDDKISGGYTMILNTAERAVCSSCQAHIWKQEKIGDSGSFSSLLEKEQSSNIQDSTGQSSLFSDFNEMKNESVVWKKFYDKTGGVKYFEAEDGKKIPMPPFLASTNIDMQRKVDVGMEIFREEFGKWMANEGIPCTPSVKLQSDSSGKIVVNGLNPYKEKIEKYFEENDDMANIIKGMTMAKSLIEAGKEHLKFQREYAVDSRAAVEKYSHLFSNKYSYKSLINICAENGYSFETFQVMNLVS